MPKWVDELNEALAGFYYAIIFDYLPITFTVVLIIVGWAIFTVVTQGG